MATKSDDKKRVLVLKILKSCTDKGNCLEVEYEHLTKIGRHPFLIEALEFRPWQETVYGGDIGKSGFSSSIAFEFLPNKDLMGYLLAQKCSTTDERWVRYWFRQLVQGLRQIHKAGFAFLDLKMENILLDENLNVRISDFGLVQPDHKHVN